MQRRFFARKIANAPTPTPPRLSPQTRRWCDWDAFRRPVYRVVRPPQAQAVLRNRSPHRDLLASESVEASADNDSPGWSSTRVWAEPALASAGPQNFLARRRQEASPQN